MQRHMTSRIQSKSNQNSLAYVKLPIASLAVLPYNNFISTRLIATYSVAGLSFQSL